MIIRYRDCTHKFARKKKKQIYEHKMEFGIFSSSDILKFD